jgi:hypothetical protein
MDIGPPPVALVVTFEQHQATTFFGDPKVASRSQKRSKASKASEHRASLRSPIASGRTAAGSDGDCTPTYQAEYCRREIARVRERMPALVDNPWYSRAEEARAIADTMRDEEAQRLMLSVAESYIKLALHAERTIKGQSES